MAAASHSKILILDFGAQYTQLIARRLRETNVYCEIHPYDVGDAFVRAFGARGIVLSGGPASVTEGETPRAPAAVWDAGVPVLGICYGMQAMAAQLGGTVEAGRVREFGYAEVRARPSSRGSRTTSAAAAMTGTCTITPARRSHRFARRLAPMKCCWDCRAAWIRRWPLRCCIGRSATS